MQKRWVLALVAPIWMLGCGGATLQCETTSCQSGGKTYQVCATTTGVTANVTYKYNGTTCSCSDTNSQCQQNCSTQITDYCEGVALDLGNSTDIASHACTISITGALTGTFMCTPTTVYASGSNLGGPTLSLIDPSGGTTAGVTITRTGMVTSGTWTNSDSGAASALTASMGEATWLADVGTSSSAPQGSYSMNLTVEMTTAVSSGAIVIAHGTVTGTLPALTATGASGTVNLTASF